jgi:hypothetical protein
METPLLKQKLTNEITEYLIIFVYLAAHFSAFTWYQSLILAEYQITSFHFWAGIVEALILAKVIMVGNALHLGERLEDRPLIFIILYKAFVFVIFTAAFLVLEDTISGLLHGKGWEEGLHKIFGEGRDELLARSLVTFVSFIPFFAFQELSRMMGEGNIWSMFFRRREKN